VSEPPTIREARLVLRTRGVLARYGLANLAITDAVREIREQHVGQVGLRRYLYDILGGRANWPATRFRLWRGGSEIPIPQRWGARRLVDVLEALAEFPDYVEVEEGGEQVKLYV
jgi:hypothetical protein